MLRYNAREGVVTAHLPEVSPPDLLPLGGIWAGLLQDTPLSVVSGSKPATLFRKFLAHFELDPLGTIAHYARLGDLLCFGDITTDDAYLLFQKTPIFREFHEFAKSGDPVVLKFLLTFCYHGKKVHIEDEALAAAALRSWKSTDEGLPFEFLVDDIKLLKLVIEALLSDSGVAAELVPKHGPGSTADVGRRLTDKYRKLSIDRSLERFIHHGGQFWHYGEYWNSGLRFLRVVSDGFERISKLSFVPKSYKAYRSICAEPAVLQYFQQAVRRLLEHEISASPYLWFVNLRNQGWNRSMCLEASVRNDVDTLDLSFASDSVSWELVTKIFPRKWVYMFAATRSTAVRTPDGDIIKVRKFAPMGSAVCFPVQCVIYSAVILAALYSHSTSETPTSATVQVFLDTLLRKKPPVGAFGDDLITPGFITQDVINRLVRLGFTVNTAKSCVGDTRVRESCGIYAYKGVDVTPLLYRQPIKPSKNKEVYASQWFQSRLSLVNRLGDNGYIQARRIAIHLLRSDPIIGRLSEGIFFSQNRDDPLAVYTTSSVVRNSTHLTRKASDSVVGSAEHSNPWSHGGRRPTVDLGDLRRVPTNVRYMRDEVRRLVIPSQADKAKLSWGSKLYEWFRCYHSDELLPLVWYDVIPVRLRWRWRPIE